MWWRLICAYKPALQIEIFSDSQVHDARTVVTQQRIDMLRKQAGSLVDHQKKLEVELQTLSTQFNEKKRAIDVDHDTFETKLRKVHSKKRFDE